MNILILSWRGPGHPNAGGAEIVTFEHAKAWARAGHKVTLYTSTFPSAKKDEDFQGIRIIRQGSQAFGVKFAAFKWYLFSNPETFDLVVDEIHGLPFFTPLYVRARKVAFVHELAKNVWKLNTWEKPFNLIPAILGPLGEPLIYKLIYSRIPFMTVSDSTSNDLKQLGIKQVTIIPNGVTTRKVLSKVNKEKVHTYTYFGSLSKDKGIEDALETFALIDDRDPKSQYWVIGFGEKNYLSYLKHKAYSLRLKNKVHFWGFVSESKKFELLKRSHIIINPSAREGWGLVVIESASVGTPTVGYKVPGLVDSIKDGKTGVLCQENNPQNLATEAVSLLSDPNRLDKLSQNAIKWSNNFTWKKSNQLSLEYIESLK